jgi:2',3'-cyclic-nucleotide 3'-phosphodiesterase
MPGSSLWLLPPKGHPLDAVLSSLIDQTSSRFGSPHRFIPHVTLTSDISPSIYSSDPKAWLDSLELPSGSHVHVKFETLASEDVLYRKLYIKCEKLDELKKLAMVCRRKVEGYEEERTASRWGDREYNPHLSLLYHDCPQLDAEGLRQTEAFVQKAGVTFGEGDLGGWFGGRVVLVPTHKPVDQWVPLVERSV